MVRAFLRTAMASLALTLASCGSELPTIKEARSVAAEWALVNQQATAGNANRVYVEEMRSSTSEQLTSLKDKLSDPDSREANALDALLALPPDASPDTIGKQVDRLDRIEKRLEVS